MTIVINTHPDRCVVKGIVIKHILFPVGVIVLALSSVMSLAEQAYDLDEIIVSGGLTPVEATTYGRAYSVLTSEQLEKRGIKTVREALRALPGVAVNSTGNSSTQVRIRGGEANHVLVLIDGVEVAAGRDEYIFSGLQTSDIERIEVLRGPQSVYYGSNASSGVISIITKRASKPGIEYGGGLEFGSDGTVGANAYVRVRSKHGGLAFSVAQRNDAGFDISGTPGGGKDRLDRTTFSLNGDYDANDDLRIGFTLRRSDEEFEFDAQSFGAGDTVLTTVFDFDRVTEREETSASVFAELDTFGGRLTHRLSYEHSLFDSVTFNTGVAGILTDGSQQALKYRGTYGLDGAAVADADQILSFAADWDRDENTQEAISNSRETVSFALEYRGNFDNGLSVQAGLRRDINEVFRDATTYNLALSYQLPGQPVRLHASGGNAIVNPSFFELFTNRFGFVGNPNLTPESNRGYDLGVEVEFASGRGMVDVTYFNETFTDEIVSSFGTGPGGSNTLANSTGESPREGVEVTASFEASDTLLLGLNYTYTDAREPNGTVEIRRPRHEVGLSATLDAFNARGTVTANVRHVSGLFDNEFFGAFRTDVKMPAFTTVDLAATYQLNNNVELYGRIENLFDKDYQEVLGFATRGATAYVGLRASF